VGPGPAHAPASPPPAASGPLPARRSPPRRARAASFRSALRAGPVVPFLLPGLLAAVAVPAVPAAARAPRIDYMLECQGCHLPDGGGRPDVVPSLRGVGRFLRVPGGRAYLVRVPGSAQAPLDDASLAAVLTWMVREFGPPEVAERMQPYTAEEVGRLRARPLLDVVPVRRELLRRLEELGAPARDAP